MKRAIAAAILSVAMAATPRAEYLNLTPSSGGKRTVLGDPVDWTGKLWSDGGIISFGNAANKVPIADSGGKLVLAIVPNLPASQTTSGTFDKDRIPATLNATTFLGAGVTSPLFNNVAITAPGSPATLTLTGGKTFAVQSSLTLNGTDGKTLSVYNSLTLHGTDGKDLNLGGNLTVSSGNFTVSGGGSWTMGGFDLIAPASGTVVLQDRTLTAGAGLDGGGDLSANRTFNVGAGPGIDVLADTVGLTVPGTLSVSSTSSSAGSHTHAVTSSSNPGPAASLLATNPSGHLQLVRLGVGIAPTEALHVAGNVFLDATTPKLYMRDTSTGLQAPSTTQLTLIGNTSLQSASFASGIYGWKVTPLGDAFFNNVDVRGAIHASLLTYNATNVTAGTQLVAKSAAKLRTDLVIPASPTYGTTTVNVDVVDQEGVSHASSQLFAVNDILKLQDGPVGLTYLKVSSASDQTTFWRYVCTIQAGTNNVTYATGLAVADFGGSGSGFIVQTADQANAPYLQMATHAATFSSASSSGTLVLTPRLRIGNLNGYGPYATDIYGFIAGQYGTAGQSWVAVDPTNGFRIGNNANTLGQWDGSGNILVGQTGSGQSNVYITSGSVKLRNNTTDYISLDTAGNALFGLTGAGQSNVYITGGAVKLRNATTDVLTLDATNGVQVFGGGNSLIQLDTSGNARFGQVANNKANIYWNASNGRLEFRAETGGTTVKSYIDTDGSFNTAGGRVRVDVEGLKLYNGGSPGFINWQSSQGGLISGQLYSLLDSNGSSMRMTSSSSVTAGVSQIYLNVLGDQGQDVRMIMNAANSAASSHPGKSWVAFRAENGANIFSGVAINPSTNVAGNTFPNHMLDVYGDGWFQSGLALRDTSAAFDVTIGATSSTALTANRIYTIDVTNASRTIKLTGNPTLDDWFNQSVKTTASPTLSALTLTNGVNSGNGFMTGYHDTFKVATDEQLHFRGHLNLADGVLLVSVNDADNALKGMEFRASSFSFTGGGIDTSAQIVGTRPYLEVKYTGDTATGRLESVVGGGWFAMIENMTFDGSNWNLQDTSLPGYFTKNDVRSGQDNFSVNRAAAGSNPRTPTQLFTVKGAGTVQLNTYGAGTASFDAAGNFTSSSDERRKDVIGAFTRGLDDLVGVKPIVFQWKESTGLDRTETYTGFSAQNVLANVPEAVGMAPDGTYTLDDRGLLATAINAINELSERVGKLDGKKPGARQAGADTKRVAELVKALDARRKREASRANPVVIVKPSLTATPTPTPTAKPKATAAEKKKK